MAPPPWTPNPQTRLQVEAMAAYGIPEKDIARVVGCAPQTLRKRCREELDTGAIKAHGQVGQFIVSSILGREGGIKDERARATLAIFFAKTRMGWRETTVLEHTGKDGGPIKTENAFNIISAALDKIADRLTGDALGDDAEAGSGEDPPEDQTN